MAFRRLRNRLKRLRGCRRRDPTPEPPDIRGTISAPIIGARSPSGIHPSMLVPENENMRTREWLTYVCSSDPPDTRNMSAGGARSPNSQGVSPPPRPPREDEERDPSPECVKTIPRSWVDTKESWLTIDRSSPDEPVPKKSFDPDVTNDS